MACVIAEKQVSNFRVVDLAFFSQESFNTKQTTNLSKTLPVLKTLASLPLSGEEYLWACGPFPREGTGNVGA